jgi:integrase
VRDEKPDHLAAVVLAGFTGLRRSEIHAQTWEDIDLKRSVLRVTSAKRGTVAYRLVNLCPAAVEWLAACARQETDAATGKTPIAPPWGMDRVRALLREREIPCPENAFRHSFITHRVAESGNIHETALQAGNSPGVVRKYYLELVGKDEGKAWFSVLPGEAREAIPFKAEGAA